MRRHSARDKLDLSIAVLCVACAVVLWALGAWLTKKPR